MLSTKIQKLRTAKSNLPADREQFLMKVGEYAEFKMFVAFDTFNHALESMLKQLSEAQQKMEIRMD